MSRTNSIPQISENDKPGFETRWNAVPRSNWDVESLSWLAPKVPLRQVICTLDAGQAGAAEQFRLLYTRLRQLRDTRPLKTILVTSCLPEEGKSFVALNLAAAISQRGRNQVLLLEADLRQPSYCSALGLTSVPGLADCCPGGDSLPSFIYRISGADLCLLPAGRLSAPPLEVLDSRRMSQVLEEVGRVFDWVLLDSAPLLPVADSTALSRLCDGILLVIRRNKTLKSALGEALERVEAAKLSGLVLNDFPSHRSCQAYFQNFAEPRSPRLLDLSNHRQAA